MFELGSKYFAKLFSKCFRLSNQSKKIENFNNKKSDFLIFQILLKISFLKHIFIDDSMLSVIRLAANGFSFKNAPIDPDAIFTS